MYEILLVVLFEFDHNTIYVTIIQSCFLSTYSRIHNSVKINFSTDIQF